MQKILSLIGNLLMQFCDLDPLFLPVSRAFLHVRQLSLFPFQLLFPFSVILCFPNPDDPKKKSPKDYIETIMEYCLSRIDTYVSVHDIAAYTGLDRAYVSRLFRQETGISLKEYKWKTKEEETCRLLIDTSLPIHVVARSVGFEDPLHFTKTFKKKLGCSPAKKERNTNQLIGRQLICKF